MALITLTGIDQSNFLDGSSGIQASDITTRQAGITTSQSFDEWRKFTNALGQDVGILARELTLLNAAGTPASDSDLSGTTTINNLSLGGHTVNDIRLDNELRAFASALDTALVTEKLLSGTKVDIDAAIDLKANITSPAFQNSAQLTHSSDTILKVKTTNTSSDAEFVLAGGTSSGFARIKFQDTASPNAYIYVNKSGAMIVKAASLNLNSAGAISGVGSGLTSLNASNLSSGTISDSRIPSTITRDTELTAFTGTANISTVGTIGTGTWQGSAINQTYIGSLPTSKITSGTFANARISQGSVTQYQTAITSVGTLTGLTINSSNNVTAAKAPTNANHLTNKTYVDTQVATKDNYQSWNFKVNTGSTNPIIKNEQITLAVQDSDTAALEFVATSNRDVSLSINLANLTTAKDGTIPNAVLPDLVIGDFSNATIQTAAEHASSFGDNDTSLLTAAAVNDRISTRLTGFLSGSIDGAFVTHIDPGTGLDVGSVDSGGGIGISLDQSEFSTLTDTQLNATDFAIIGDANAATPKRIKFQDISLNLLDHVNKLQLAELSNVDDAAASSGEFLKWDGSKWIGDSIANKISISNLTNVSGADSGNSTGDLLRWNGTSWTDSTPTEVADYASPQIDLADLKNVTASPSSGQFLKWSGSAWVASADNNTTYSASSTGGLTLSTTTFSMKNAGNLTANSIMRWDNTNNQLTNTALVEHTNEFRTTKAFMIKKADASDADDYMYFDVNNSTNATGTLAVANHSIFSNASTRKAGISFRGDSASNDFGVIVHESGIVSGDNNKSVIHICPGDDVDNTNDVVAIHGKDEATSTGLLLGTGGNITQVDHLEFREGSGASSEASGFTHNRSTSGLVDGNLYLQRTNSSSTESSRRGGRIFLAKPHNDDWGDASLRGAKDSWLIETSPIGTTSGASLQVYEWDNGSGASRFELRSNEYSTAGIGRLPTANKDDIGNSGTGTEKDIVTYEKLVSYTDERIVQKLFGPRPEFIMHYKCETGYRQGNGSDGGKYDSNPSNALMKIKLLNLEASGFVKHSSLNRYFLLVRFYTGKFGGDDASEGGAYISTSSDDTGYYEIRNSNMDNGGMSKNSGNYPDQRFTWEIHDMVTNRTYIMRTPLFSNLNSINGNDTRFHKHNARNTGDPTGSYITDQTEATASNSSFAGTFGLGTFLRI